jgi:hypothetical protein
MFENLQVEQEAMRERQSAVQKAKRSASARQAAKSRPKRRGVRKPRRRRDPLSNAIRLLRWRLRKEIAAGRLAPDTDITNETLRREILRKRHARNAIRSWRRKTKQVRSERWSAMKTATAERRAGIEQRKNERVIRRQQEEQFRRELQISKPKSKKELDIDQRIAAAYAEGFQAGKRFSQETQTDLPKLILNTTHQGLGW